MADFSFGIAEMAEPEKPYPNDCRTSCCGGCIVGPLLCFATFFAVSGEWPERGGIFLLPFFMFFGTILTWIGLSIYEIWQQYRKRKK